MMNGLMMIFTDLSPVVTALAKLTILLLAAWTLDAMLRHRNPRWRRLMWRGVMIGLVTMPVLEVAGPKIEWVIEPSAWGIAPGFLNTSSGAFMEPAGELSLAVMPALDGSVSPESSNAPRPKQGFAVHYANPALWTGVWLTGFLVLAARRFIGRVGLNRMLKRTERSPDHIATLAQRVAADLAGRRRFHVRSTSGEFSPFVAGFLRPVIVLPESLAAPDRSEDLRCVLAHEVSHLRAGDLAWMSTGGWIATALWFHPLAWRMNAAHGRACEEVCDGIASGYAGGTDVYAGALARMALDVAKSRAIAGAVSMIGGAEITRRVSVH